MWVKKRHKIAFAIFRPIFALFLRIKYGYKAVPYQLEKQPYLIICNHVTTLDPFMLGASFKVPIYFMASDELFIKKFYSKAMKYLVAPIPKKKSASDINAIKTCIRITKEGGSIALFPEGNRTYSGKLCYVDPAIVKMIKLLKIPLVIYNIKGGYGVESRWSNHISKGKSYGEVVEVLSPEQIQALDFNTLYKYIIKKLDVVDAPSEALYKSKQKAEKLERVLYLCPRCQTVNSIYTIKNDICCRQCDLDVKFTENLTFIGNIDFKTVNDWYEYQEQFISNYQIKDNDEIFCDENVKLIDRSRGVIPTVLHVGRLSITNDKFTIENAQAKHQILIPSISGVTVVGKNRLDIYVNDRTYHLKGEEGFNVLKYMQIFYKIKGVKDEIFRL